jgi:putative transposase
MEGYPAVFPPPRFTLSKVDPHPDGVISVIRFIRSDRKLDIFGERFTLPDSLVYTYVRAKIVTALHQIQVYLAEDLVTVLPYQLPPWITPWEGSG